MDTGGEGLGWAVGWIGRDQSGEKEDIGYTFNSKDFFLNANLLWWSYAFMFLPQFRQIMGLHLLPPCGYVRAM